MPEVFLRVFGAEAPPGARTSVRIWATDFSPSIPAEVAALEAAGWRIAVSLQQTEDAYLLSAQVEAQGEGGICLGFGEEAPAGSHLSIPAAVYAGNRFRILPLKYPCILEDPADFVPDLPTTVSRIPALPSLQLLAGDASVPAIGIAEAGWWLRTSQRCDWGDIGLEAIETDKLRVAFLFPGVREGRVYEGNPEWRESPDQAPRPAVGATLSVRIVRTTFESTTPRDLYRSFFSFRKRGLPEGGRHSFPFSAAARLLEDKHNQRYWNESLGYYMLSDGTWEYGQWQAGWVGGGIQTYGLAYSEAPETLERVNRMLDFISGPAQNPSGLYWSFCIDGRFDTDMVDMTYGHDWHLVRRSGDVLYFLLKTIDLRRRQGRPIKGEWLSSARRAADALSSIWEKNDRFGMFVSQFDGEIRSGDTTSGGIIPAALVHAYIELDDPRYLEVARASARAMVERYLNIGYTNGGPGEAVHAPDSESCFGLLESLVELHELDPQGGWLADAEACAHLASTWVMPYDFAFPPESTLGRLDIRTTGSVWANLQNKHSAPGICTLSGSSLLKLARATGDPRYLELLRDIAHGVVQYLYREDQPIFDMLPGGSCERVNTSDWEGDRIPVGEGFNIDCWSSISALLTVWEVPGIYVDPQTGRCVTFDHVDAVLEGSTLHISNPTQFDARISVHVEPGAGPLGSSFTYGLPSVQVRAGQTVSLAI